MNTATQQLHANDSPVRVDQGGGRFTTGIVCKFNRDERVHGNRGFYYIRVTGGVNCFGKPSTVGEVRRVLHTNVLSA
jgi:hypothetical protein